jgi:hypothetical protein
MAGTYIFSKPYGILNISHSYLGMQKIMKQLRVNYHNNDWMLEKTKHAASGIIAN